MTYANECYTIQIITSAPKSKSKDLILTALKPAILSSIQDNPKYAQVVNKWTAQTSVAEFVQAALNGVQIKEIDVPVRDG